MRFATPFAAVVASVPFFSGLASAECFGSGSRSWGNSGDIKEAHNAVNKYCENGRLSGDFSPYQLKHVCINLSGNHKADFEMKKNIDGYGNMQVDHCKKYLGELIDKCEYGGKGSQNSYVFKSDPNSGQCD